jgi:Thioredoxin
LGQPWNGYPDYGRKAKVAKLNVVENQGIVMKYGTRSIPSLLLSKNGKGIVMSVGAALKKPTRDSQNSRYQKIKGEHIYISIC